MNLILLIPIGVRLTVLFVAGACLGGLANLGIYRLAYHRRRISPFSAPADNAPPRRLSDRVPIIGWLGLRREESLHGRGFWIRPLLLELLAGIGLAALYWWEIGCQGLLPERVPLPAPEGVIAVLHGQYVAHAILLVLMLVASMIDIDEKSIPDAITVPGVLTGLVLGAVCPWTMLPVLVSTPGGVSFPPPDGWWLMHLASPNAWPGLLDGGYGALIGLGCWLLWCVALLPRTWYARHGWRRAWQLMTARLAREPVTRLIVIMGLIGSVAIAAVWQHGGRAWVGLLSALVGMAASGGLVWTVRIVCSAALNREAMGFGDVTLMAMIGAFLGWQSCLMIFFLAPFAGLVVGLLRLILFRDTEIPYGPFLCLATVAVIVRWASLWDWAFSIFSIGWLVPVTVGFCLLLMPIMLGLWRLTLAALPVK